MPRNAEIVRAVYEGVRTVREGRDPGDAFDLVADDGELLPAPEVPGAESYRGIDGFMEFLWTWTEAFESWAFAIERLIGVGDDRVVALLHQWGTGKGSGAPVDLHFAAVHRFEDGRMVETRLYMNPADALESTGVSLLYAGGVDAYIEGGLEGLAETWHEDVVYEEDPLFPGSGTYRGRAATLARFREYEEQLGPSTVSIEEILTSAHCGVVVWRHSGVTPASGVPFEQRWAWVVRERDGKAIHIRAYLDPDEAFKAAT